MDNYPGRRSFEREGFLGPDALATASEIRERSQHWFSLAEDLNHLLQSCATLGTERNRGLNYEARTIATRLLMRTCGNLQGVILTAERGMVTSGLLLARSLIEDAFCMAALHEEPETFIGLLKADAEAARREQGRFIIAQDLLGSADPATVARLKEVVDSIGKDPKLLSPKRLAAMGPVTKLYLAYQKLSNDAAHPSATSLHRFIATAADRTGWNYRWGPGKQEEVEFALHQAIHAAIPTGIGFTIITEDAQHNEAFGPLMDRVASLPEPQGRVDVSSIGL